MLFRPARPAHPAWNVIKTVLFLLAFWFLFLFVLPIAISIVEVRVGLQRFPPQPLAALILLLGGAIVTGWSAVVLSLVGRGTPAPIDTARGLVTAGPYRFVRHPFALGACAQTVGVALAFGSVPVMAYALVMFAVWYGVVRPREEADLEARFGHEWRRYAQAVRGLVPRLRPYRSEL